MDRRRFLALCGTSLASGCARLPRDETPVGTPVDVGRSPTSPGADATTATGESTASAGDGSTTPVFPGYDTVEVRVRTPDGDSLGSVTAAVADTPKLHTRGLSDTASLPPDYGMLFVYDEVDDRTFVMREMDFGIDIVFADADKRITTIHHAPEPGPTEDGEEQEYPGRGQYVLEVNIHWTSERGVGEGDLLAFDR